MRRNLGHNGHRLVIILIPILLNDIPAVYASTDAEPDVSSFLKKNCALNVTRT